MADYSIPELLKLIEADTIYIPKSVARRDDIYGASKGASAIPARGIPLTLPAMPMQYMILGSAAMHPMYLSPTISSMML